MTNRLTDRQVIILLISAIIAMGAVFRCSPPLANAQDTSRIGPASAYQPAYITGDYDQGVTQATIKSTICTDHYTAGVRDVSEMDKQFVLKRDHQTAKGCCEVDHLVSLELGGSNDRDKNLWAQPYAGRYGARVKDGVEKALNLHVCGKKQPTMSLLEARKCIVDDWIACGQKIGVIK